MSKKQLPPHEHYYKFSSFLKKRYGERVQKITINAGLTCPNRDGTAGWGGCIYCNNQGFNVNVRKKPASIKDQIRSGLEYGKKKNIKKFIAYFQPFSNTYDTPENLKKYYDSILDFPEIVGLSIGTRPDCVDSEKLELINSYTKTHMVWMEYGLQTIHARTLKHINRGHTYADFENALTLTKHHPALLICIHMIVGLPGETREDILQSANMLATLPFDGIKLHPLHIVKDTALETLYHDKRFSPLFFDEYVGLSCDYLERIPPSVTIQRIAADAPQDLLIAPLWVSRKMALLNAIDNEFRRRNTQQGSLYSPSH